MLYLIRDVAVHVQSKRRSMMAEVALHGLDVVPRLERHHGERVPLWHNKDKSENPCGATGWLVCPYSFSTKNGPRVYGRG